MKIIDATVLLCCPGRNFLTLIYIDEEVCGLGDATLNGRELPVGSSLTDHVIPCLIGRDPFQPRTWGSTFIVVRTGGAGR